MLKDVYIIKNTINNKVYIGQAINTQKRFTSHKSRSKLDLDNSILHKAMKKYGIENFYVEILESQIKNYNEREKYWISKFNSIYPNGYNILKGGEEPPLLKGEKHWNASLTQEQVNILIDELINSNMTLAKIAKCYNVNYTILRHINYGEAWRDEKLSYPLKQDDDRNILKNRKNIEDIFYLLKESSCSMEQIGKYFNVSRKVIERINKGETYYQNISYPLRTQRKRSVETVEQALLKGGR